MDSSTRRRRRGARTVVAGVGLALLLTGCGFDVQTLQPYTPAHGVNVEAGSIKVRNLLVVSDDSGKGVVSASILSPKADKLVKVEGAPIKLDGSKGAPFTASGSVDVPANQLAVLTNGAPAFSVSSADLKPGLTADVKLTFESGATAAVVAPVMSKDSPIYSTIAPAAGGSASASASPSASASASASASPSASASASPSASGSASPTPSKTP